MSDEENVIMPENRDPICSYLNIKFAPTCSRTMCSDKRRIIFFAIPFPDNGSSQNHDVQQLRNLLAQRDQEDAMQMDRELTAAGSSIPPQLCGFG